jgi:hypothetical protein
MVFGDQRGTGLEPVWDTQEMVLRRRIGASLSDINDLC